MTAVRTIGLLIMVAVLIRTAAAESDFQRSPSTSLENIAAQTNAPNWPMAGANPQRTSAIAEGTGGSLSVSWVRPVEPYISQKIQIVAYEGALYLSTAQGLYSLDAASGEQRWVYPTAMPLGHSPTVADGVVYVGGFDRLLHAIDAMSGERRWVFQAGAGFQTNPLVIEGKVIAGNRDGLLYAVDAESGKLVWKFRTEGPILFSPAYAEGVVTFASNDSHAYALQVDDGTLLWKSEKLPGMGFHSFWPVIAGNYVIFAGGAAFHGKMHTAERDDIFPNWESDADGTLVGPVTRNAEGTPMLVTSKTNESASSTSISDYFEAKPWRRTLFVLDRQTGREITYDFDEDGELEYAPALWSGTTGSGNRYPPALGPDGLLYFRNTYLSDGSIPGGGVTGWLIDTPYVTLPQARELGGYGDWPVDEPGAYAIGGSYLYYNHCCDRLIGALDLAQANLTPPADRISPRPEHERQWRYRDWRLPGYNSQLSQYLWQPGKTEADGQLYFAHGDQNAPIPYNGMVYVHRSNALIAFAANGRGELLSPLAAATSMEDPPVPEVDALQALLAEEVQEIVNAGHLRPGYSPLGLHNHLLQQVEPFVLDYFHNPEQTITVMLRALPYLPPELQAQVRDYVQAQFAATAPYAIRHVGWQEGAPRGVFELPELYRGSWTQRTPGMALQSLYALWKYAEIFGGANEIFEWVQDALLDPPPDEELLQNPQRHNATIAAYIGYLGLEQLAGRAESSQKREELDRLLALRAESFEFYPPISTSQRGSHYFYSLLISWNFMNLVPELGSYLRTNSLEPIAEAVAGYEAMTPYWFVTQAEEVQGEGVLAPLHHYHALFQAKALILNEPYPALARYLDVPVFARGDLFYIDNLVSAIEAGDGSVTSAGRDEVLVERGTAPSIEEGHTEPDSPPTPDSPAQEQETTGTNAQDAADRTRPPTVHWLPFLSVLLILGTLPAAFLLWQRRKKPE